MTEWNRIDGDQHVAIAFRAAQELISEAARDLGIPGTKHADRCIWAADKLGRAQLLLTKALSDLERVTGVPWEAIAQDPSFGPASPPSSVLPQ